MSVQLTGGAGPSGSQHPKKALWALVKTMMVSMAISSTSHGGASASLANGAGTGNDIDVSALKYHDFRDMLPPSPSVVMSKSGGDNDVNLLLDGILVKPVVISPISGTTLSVERRSFTLPGEVFNRQELAVNLFDHGAAKSLIQDPNMLHHLKAMRLPVCHDGPTYIGEALEPLIVYVSLLSQTMTLNLFGYNTLATTLAVPDLSTGMQNNVTFAVQDSFDCKGFDITPARISGAVHYMSNQCKSHSADYFDGCHLYTIGVSETF
ncbi:hypothetical protein ANO11243_015190 [Dothideomycetidae sp. 11243]|nr:hypothetical protein ANO11243_015190 [fungal sp. No.11243]